MVQPEPHILYADEAILAISKPALIHSASQKESTSPSVAHWLIENFAGMGEVSENSDDGGLINRLDFETSGILVAAKHRSHWLALREQFGKHQIEKKYYALVEGKPSVPLPIVGYLGSRYRGSKKVTFLKQAEKRFQYSESRISTLVAYDTQGDNSLIEIEAHTGARHQIRVHCASIGHPLIGDLLYGSKKTIQQSNSGIPAFALHAAEIEFLHPESQERVCFKVAAPSYFSLETCER